MRFINFIKLYQHTNFKDLYLSCNGFTGEIDLRFLPDTLKHLNLKNNKLSGSLNLSALPLLNGLDISNNTFVGPFKLDALPLSLEIIRIKRNQFTGNLHLSDMPESCFAFIASHNNFSGALICRICRRVSKL